MTAASFHGAETRRPVVYGGRRIRGLHERTLKNGSVIFEARLRVDGKDTRVVLDVLTRTDAVREFENLRADRNRGTVHENPTVNPTVAELADDWIAHLSARVGIDDEKLRRKAGTVYGYRGIADNHILPFIGAKRAVEVTVADLRRFVAYMQTKPVAPVTVSNAVRTFSSMLSFGVKHGYLAHNPYRDLHVDDRPSTKRRSEPRYLSAGEVVTLLDAAVVSTHGNDYRPILACMVYAALRIGEALGLPWRNVDFATNTITISQQLSHHTRTIDTTKTLASNETVPMVPALRRELLAYRARMAERNLALVRADALVFVTVRNTPYAYATMYRAMRAIGNRAGLNPEGAEPIGNHDLRHTAIALAIQHGATLVEASELARHASPTVTLARYAGLAKDARGGATRKLLEAGFGV